VEWIDALEGKVVGLDTAPLIYLIEEHPVYLPLVRPFFEAADRGRLSFVTSVVTLLFSCSHSGRGKKNWLVNTGTSCWDPPT
jgi:hypothetical protein